MADTIANKPEQVKCFVEGSIKGWYNYLYGDNAAANALIIAANPDMTQDKIDYAIERMLAEGIVDSGDALEMGIGAINPEVVEDFYGKMVAAGVIADGIDWQATYTADYVNKGLGMDLKPAN